jgi:non-heme Fe2+,alpha-ketoglutarate-dependent halogenase
MTFLTAEQTAAFAENGYVGPFSLIPSADAEKVRTMLVEGVLPRRSWIYDHTQSDVPAMHFNRDRHLDSPAVFRLCSDQAIVGRVASLIGDDLLLWRSDFFVQGPADPYTKPHQDKKFSGMRKIPALEAADGGMPMNVTAWIALSHMTEHNGGLFLIPGSHREGVIEEVPVVDKSKSIFGKGTVLSKEYEEAAYYRPVMEPGQFMLFDNLIVHGSSPTKSERARVAISARFVSTSVRINPRGTETSGHGLELSRFGSLLVSGLMRGSENVLRAPPLGNAAKLAADDVACVDLAQRDR